MLLMPRSALLASHATGACHSHHPAAGRETMLENSKGFDRYLKEAGLGMTLWKIGVMAKLDCVITTDGVNFTIKTESTLKATQFSCNLREKFQETTADGRKTQTCLKLYK